MRKITYLLALLFTASIFFFGCGSDNDDPTPDPPPPNIVVPDREELTQNVYADEEEGESGVRFTTAAAWTSSITTRTTSAADADYACEYEAETDEDAETRSTANWVSITPSSGQAGNHAVTLNLDPNLIGIDRFATITITSAGATIEINITQQGVRVDGTVGVTGVTLNRNATTLTVGGTETLTANVAPATATNRNVTWASNNTAVATVNASGLVTAVSQGTATITATTQEGAHTATATVTVNAQVFPVTGVTLNRTTTTLQVGSTETLIVTVAPANATNRNVTWASNNTAVATVNNNGLVTALSAGTAIITVTTQDGNRTATCTVTVTADPIAVTGVILNRSATTIPIGGNETLIATISPANATNRNVTWSSSDTSIATVDANGRVTGVSMGTAVIMVTTADGGRVATCAVAVVIPVTGVTLNRTATSLVVGYTEMLTATVAPANATNQNITWRSSNTSIATVSANGLVTAVSPGTATITVTTQDGSRTATCEVAVTPVLVTGVTLNRTTTHLNVGSSETLTATIAPANATNRNVTWGSNDISVATVDANGRVTAITTGTATITVTTDDGARTASSTIHVATPLFDVGVVVNGVRWATRNVDAPGTFAQSPQNAGMFYQWNRRVGWSSTNPMINSNGGTFWDNSYATGTEWYAANDPCPVGWRVPTTDELHSLGYGVRVANWNNTGQAGLTFGTPPNQLFLPATDARTASTGSLQHRGARPWSSEAMGPAGGWVVNLDRQPDAQWRFTGLGRAYALTVRCVAE